VKWTKGILVPERSRLRATAGSGGARAAEVLYRQRRPRTLAWVASWGRSLALRRGIGRRCDPPIAGFDDLCELLGITPIGAASIRSWLADRVVLYVVGQHASVVVKVGGPLDSGLANESALLVELDGAAGPITVPRVRWYGAWMDRLVLATEAIPLAGSRRDVNLEEALDASTALSAGAATVGPLVHGDLSPWNLLRTPQGLALVDWEEARIAREPLFDLAHFVVSSCALVWRDKPERALTLLTKPGSLGWRHLTALSLDPLSAPALVENYLERTWAHTETSWEYRKALLQLLGPILADAPGRGAGFATTGVRPGSVGEAPR
jgi:hypothetical protein